MPRLPNRKERATKATPQPPQRPLRRGSDLATATLTAQQDDLLPSRPTPSVSGASTSSASERDKTTRTPDQADTRAQIAKLTKDRDEAIRRSIDAERIIEALSRALDTAEAGPGMTADEVAALRRKHDRAVRDLDKATEKNKKLEADYKGAVEDHKRALNDLSESKFSIGAMERRITAAEGEKRKVTAERDQLLAERNRMLAFLQGKHPLPE
ncbi:uncharacterized protein LOC62_02G002510 [Vanrija pseudolonga]|uniref:Uncharacterized protein n=1 Tax=Vanrija pseudolonga TaxID=143232 RepID=A0AAF1BGK6_9TREE|nr:hypothetical protein LOC62_02G002510 [Vanrija pseudolonga]